MYFVGKFHNEHQEEMPCKSLNFYRTLYVYIYVYFFVILVKLERKKKLLYDLCKFITSTL